MNATILVVGDEPAIIELAGIYREREGRRALKSGDGARDRAGRGGEVGVESEVGTGTQFWMRLPLR